MTRVPKSIWFLLILIGISVAFNFLMFGNPAKHSNNRAAPLFATQFGETQFDLKKEIGSKIVLVNFWATWCAPCREEVPLLNELVAKVASDQFMIAAVMEDSAQLSDAQRQEELKKFSQKIPINYPVFSDADGRIADAYGTYKLPESYLIDADGNIIFKQTGPFAPQQIADLVNKIKTEIKRL